MSEKSIPTRVFIIPYRDRPIQKKEFIDKMKFLLEDFDANTYEIYFAHQNDERPFNRGAMKNIGFLAIKNKYPNNYKDITFIFHDVDTYPCEKGLIDYTTTHGVVKHYYGYKFALGGIFAIKGADFEKVKGFPNFWGWGLEDNTINDRCKNNSSITIDRSIFYDIQDKRIVRPFDGFNRVISKRDGTVYKFETPDDLTHLTNLKWDIVNEFINIYTFDCMMNPYDQDYSTHDIRNGSKMFVQPGYQRKNWKMHKIMQPTQQLPRQVQEQHPPPPPPSAPQQVHAHQSKSSKVNFKLNFM
jgi:hypothetical protein